MVTNTSDPGGEPSRVLPPLDKQFWWGRVSLGSGRIVAVTPLGLDGPTDSIRQASERRVDFSCVITGDQDGGLIELDRWQPDDVLTVELYAADRLTGDDERWPMPLWGERSLKPVAIHRISLDEITKGPQIRAIDDRSSVLVERVSGALDHWREFDLTLSEGVKPDDENYVYVRAQQIDDHVVWSSPVWVRWR